MQEDVGAEQIEAACKTLTARGARLLLTPSAPTDAAARILAAASIQPVVFDPCFQVGPGEDFLTVMAANRTRLQAALRAAPK